MRVCACKGNVEPQNDSRNIHMQPTMHPSWLLLPSAVEDWEEEQQQQQQQQRRNCMQRRKNAGITYLQSAFAPCSMAHASPSCCWWGRSCWHVLSHLLAAPTQPKTGAPADAAVAAGLLPPAWL
jgi:hypothetical protein